MGNTRGIPAKVKDKKKSYPHSWLFKLVVDLLANTIIRIRTEKKKKGKLSRLYYLLGQVEKFSNKTKTIKFW